MASIHDPLDRLSNTNFAKPLDTIAEPLKKFTDDPVQNPVEKTKRAAAATQNVIQSTFDPTYKPHSVTAQKIVLAKGFFDVFLSLSLVFFPSLLYDGPVPKALSYVTPLVSGVGMLDKHGWLTPSNSLKPTGIRTRLPRTPLRP